MASPNKLRGLVVAQYGSIRRFAECLGWSYAKAYRIVTGVQEPNSTDISCMAEALHLEDDAPSIVEVFILPWCSQNAND